MSTPQAESSVAQLSAKLNDIIFAIKFAFCLLLFGASVPNILASQEIETYRQIFQDALPGKALPDVTLAVLAASTFLRILALAWPIIGIAVVVFGKRPRYWIITASILFILIGLQAIVTMFSFFMPMNGLIVGMEDAPPK